MAITSPFHEIAAVSNSYAAGSVPIGLVGRQFVKC